MIIHIIDDDIVYREVLARSLSRLNCQVETHSHPETAIPQISHQSSPVILLDLKLENDSGLRWVKAIRQCNAHAKINLLTGYSSISTAVEAIKLGADDYLTKPITAREILKHLQKNKSIIDDPIANKPMSVERLEWEHIQKVLQDNNGNISACARALNMHRRTLQRKLAKKPTSK